MRRNGLVIGMTALVLVFVVLLAFHLFSSCKEEILSQFQEHQLSHAQQIAHQIESFFGARKHGLQILSSFLSLQYGDSEQKRSDILAYFKQMENIGANVAGISLCDENGKVICSTSDHEVGLNYGQREFFVWAEKRENRGKSFISPVGQLIQESGGETYVSKPSAANHSPSPFFLLSVPIYQDSLDANYYKPSGKFLGALSFTIALKGFLANQLDLETHNMGMHQLWIADKTGKLLYQSEHPEMGLCDIHQRDERCTRCHKTFDHVEEILRMRQGTTDYEVGNSPKKIAAFASMDFENASWTVVVKSSYEEVIQFATNSLREHILLLGIVFFAFIAGSALLVRNERFKIKAEEETERLKVKMAERERAQKAVALERNKLRSILDTMKDGVYIVNKEYKILYVNPALEKEFGPVNGRRCHEYFHDLPEACSWCKNQKVFTGKTAQWEWHSFKTDKTYDLFDTPIMNEDGSIAKLEIFHDITDRKIIEKALQESEELHRITLGSISDAIFITDDDGVFEYICPNVEVIFGYASDEVKAFGNISCLIGDHLFDRDQLESLGEIRNVEREIFDKTGRHHFLLINVKRVSVKRGTILYTCHDVTERKQAETQLSQSEERYRMLVETMNEGLGVQDEKGHWVYVNQRLCEMTGYSREEMIGHPVAAFLNENGRGIYDEEMRRRRRGENEPFEISWLRKDGQRMYALVAPKPILNERGEFKGSFAVITDITERRKAMKAVKDSEQQLRRLSSELLTTQEKERGRISRELHDELGQALAVLKLRIGGIKENLHQEETEAIKECDRNLWYVDQVIENVRRISRDLSPSILQDAGLTVALQWMAENVAAAHQMTITLDITDVNDLFPSDSQIMIYRIAQEALTNIVKHAQAKNISLTIRKNGDGATLLVEDDGKGFNAVEAVQGNGKKGLGLVTMKERARMLGGMLDLKSRGGKGTQLTMTIPTIKGSL